MKHDWQIKKLGDVCEIVGGGTPSKKNLKFYEGNIRWATVRDMKSDVISETEFRITNDAVRQSATNIIPRGNVVIATRVGLGKVCLIANDTAINQDLRGVIPRNKKAINLDIRFLFHWLKSISNLIVAEGKGATVQGVTLPFIKNILIPLPPLAEQQRIVAILDRCFAAIAKVKANAEQNLKNAKELFESYLQGVFDNKGEGWEEKKLGEVCTTGAGGTPLKTHKDYYENGSIPWLLSGEVGQGEIFEAKNFITEKGLKNSSAKLFPTDTVLIAMYGATAGQVGILRFEACTNQAVCGILPNQKYLCEFLYYYFLSKKEKLVAQAVGGAQPNISQIKIRNTLVPVIPHSKQQSIVRQLDALRAATQKLEVAYQNKIKNLEELKKSILQKAFAGELCDHMAEDTKTIKG